MCFHAQQCAEKALKAVLVAHSVAFPKTHSLAVLLDLLKAAGVTILQEVDEAFSLTQYAVMTRYPGAWEQVSTEEAQAALNTATEVLDWATAQIESGS